MESSRSIGGWTSPPFSFVTIVRSSLLCNITHSHVHPPPVRGITYKRPVSIMYSLASLRQGFVHGRASV